MYEIALKIAYNAHKNQYRNQSNVPYITHSLRVSYAFNDDFKKTIAILHDVVEDTTITLDDLKKIFPKRIVDAIDSLSKRDGEKHFDYINRLLKNKDAIEIKIVDVMDNLSDTLCVVSKSMSDRYNKTLGMLIK